MENCIKYKNKQGDLVNGRILYAYEVKNDNVCVVYTDDKKLNDGSLKTYAIIYDEKNNDIKSINNEEEYKIIEKLLISFTKTEKE